MKEQSIEICEIIHTKTGFFFNGFCLNETSIPSKNMLSANNSKRFITRKRSDLEIIDSVFQGHTILIGEKEYVHNHIVYKGSDIYKKLSEYYKEIDYLPIEDFHVKRL